MFRSTRKTERSVRRTVSLHRPRYEEGVDWHGYLEPHLIEARELSTLDEGDAPSAVDAARAGEQRPTKKSQGIALELKQLELEINKLTQRWTPRFHYYVKD